MSGSALYAAEALRVGVGGLFCDEQVSCVFRGIIAAQ